MEVVLFLLICNILCFYIEYIPNTYTKFSKLVNVLIDIGIYLYPILVYNIHITKDVAQREFKTITIIIRALLHNDLQKCDFSPSSFLLSSNPSPFS